MGMFTICASLALASLQACGGDDTSADDNNDGDASVSSSSSGKTGSSSGRAASSSSSSGGSSGGASSSSSGGASSSSGGSSSGESDAGDPDASVGACGDVTFGKAAAAFTQNDIESFAGGDILAGTYDAVRAEIGSTTAGSIRETVTFTADGRFTRIRQLTVTAAGPVTVRTGTYSTNDGFVTFTADCQTSDGAVVTPENQSTPYDFVGPDAGVAKFRYGAAGIRFTLEKR